jgi:ribonuclease HI
MLNVYIDGSCAPENPSGYATWGMIVKRDNEYLAKLKDIVGHGLGMSNNVAEFSALIAFLEWYLKTGKFSSLGILDYEPALIHSDSNLLVNQMNGNWKVKNGLYVNHYIKARNLINNHGLQQKITFKWIPREENTEADELSKRALYDIGIITK